MMVELEGGLTQISACANGTIAATSSAAVRRAITRIDPTIKDRGSRSGGRRDHRVGYNMIFYFSSPHGILRRCPHMGRRDFANP
jgi:hypothetical protein